MRGTQATGGGASGLGEAMGDETVKSSEVGDGQGSF